MLKLILLIVMLVTVAAPSDASRKGRLAPIHIQYFELRDDSGEGYSLGRYYADSPNGQIHVEQNGSGGFKRSAFYRFVGPAEYEDGTPIPGTEDDVLLLDLTLHWHKNNHFFTFLINELALSGTSLHFDNGEPLDYYLTLPFDGSIDVALGTADMKFQNKTTDVFHPLEGVQSKTLSYNEMVWEQSMKGDSVDFVNVPLPEPSMLLGLATGVLVLVGLKGRSSESA